MKLIAGGLIVTMNQKREIIEDGAVAIEDNKIVDVGKHEELKKKYRTDEVMDARGKIILPGLICTHTHMPYVLGHNMPVDLSKLKSFIELLTKWAWPMLEDKITKDYIYHASLFACMRMVKSGTTCINEMVEAPFDIKGCLDYSAKAVEEIGMRANIAYEATERVSVENAKEGINENLRFAKSWNQKNESRIRGRFGVHTAFTCSPEMLKEVRELATKHNAGIHIHIAESTYEIEFLKNKYGKTSVELLHEIEFLGPDVLAAHCIHLSDNDLRLMKLNEVRVSHTPMSNMLGACGVARVPDMLDMGIVVSLGHDCFFTLDIFEYMRAAFLLHKIHRLNPLVMAPHQVLEMVTINGAKALGLESEVGSIEVGKKADIIIAKPVSPTPVNAFTLASYLVSDVNGSNVETVIIDGKTVVENGKLRNMDEDRIVSKCQEMTLDLWKSNNLL